MTIEDKLENEIKDIIGRYCKLSKSYAYEAQCLLKKNADNHDKLASVVKALQIFIDSNPDEYVEHQKSIIKAPDAFFRFKKTCDYELPKSDNNFYQMLLKKNADRPDILAALAKNFNKTCDNTLEFYVLPKSHDSYPSSLDGAISRSDTTIGNGFEHVINPAVQVIDIKTKNPRYTMATVGSTTATDGRKILAVDSARSGDTSMKELAPAILTCLKDYAHEAGFDALLVMPHNVFNEDKGKMLFHNIEGDYTHIKLKLDNEITKPFVNNLDDAEGKLYAVR